MEIFAVICKTIYKENNIKYSKIYIVNKVIA